MAHDPSPPGRAANGQDPFADAVAVLMAGGAGTRFWPLSTPDLPKQFLKTLMAKPLYAQAADRARLMVPWDRILVMTHTGFAALVREQTPDAPAENVVFEPMRRDTAAAVILAAVVVHRRWPGSVMIVMPSDHVISNLEGFRRTLASAVARARRGGLGTVGIPPTFPATVFGYLRLAGPAAPAEAVRVEEFVEKPDRPRAEQYLADGRHLWNAGIFVWKAETLLAAAERHLPDTYGRLAPLAECVGTPAFADRVREAFEALQPLSIDYGIMEKAGDVWAVPAAFGWNDVGGWLAAGDLIPADADGNHVVGNAILSQATGNVVITDARHPLIVAGIHDCIIVHGPAGTLACHKSLADGLKALVQKATGK
jgi:mannose-1-phosphate guanylyltransferase